VAGSSWSSNQLKRQRRRGSEREFLNQCNIGLYLGGGKSSGFRTETRPDKKCRGKSEGLERKKKVKRRLEPLGKGGSEQSESKFRSEKKSTWGENGTSRQRQSTTERVAWTTEICEGLEGAGSEELEIGGNRKLCSEKSDAHRADSS